MNREEITQICEREVLEPAARLFGTSKTGSTKIPDSEGCANLVYEYQRDGQARMLRITYRPERPVAVVQAELHFVNYLAEGGVRVSRPVPSENGNLLEMIQAEGIPFIVASFVKGRGMRMPDNGYRYRVGAPMEEYYTNWGQALGQMHRLTKSYKPPSNVIRRPEWFEWEAASDFPYREQLPRIAAKYDALIAELKALPRDLDSFGLIHNDFNDGNFTVDYENGDITVFDFDDSCYFWFVYDLACAWEGGVGWARYRPLRERIDFMAHYMEQVMAGYNRENTLSAAWMQHLPLFLRLVQMQELSYFAQYLDEPDEDIQGGLRYKIHCIEEELLYLGFFDPGFNPEKPFRL